MEAKLGRYLKWYEVVHHKDKNPSNNRLSNLQLTTIWEHKSLHKKDYGQMCTTCGNKDVKRNGFNIDKQIFRYNTCKTTWTVNKITGIDFGQVCCNCGSKHVVRCGIKNNKQWFRCNDCRKYWRVPLQDLKEVVSDNDRQYRVANILGSR